MNPQTLTQTINIIVGTDGLGLASTGSSLLPLIAIGITLITAALLTLRFGFRRAQTSRFSRISHNLNFRSLTILILFATASIALTLNLHTAQAIPTLILGANQDALTLTVPEGGGTASTTTTLTSSTTNPEGYTLTASLSEPEPGITIKLKGGNITTPTALTPGDPALTLRITNSASNPNTPDTTDITLDFTIDATVTPGKKDLKLAYTATDNGSTGPLTMQSFTTAQCSALPTYTGANEEAVITLSDPRGAGQTYQVAKLADNNCWMLDNLKLGSTTGSLTLTPGDTDIAADFTLPQLYSGDSEDYVSYDEPYVYGPIPGDTGEGETNYGYLYNWSAATAGETAESIPGEGTAPYSVCPVGWRLPAVVLDYENSVTVSGDFTGLDQAFGGTGEGSFDGEPNIAKWQSDGPFKGAFNGYWAAGFDGQGYSGNLWLSVAPPVPEAAFQAQFGPDFVYPITGTGRVYGYAVRCVLDYPI